MRHRIGTRAEQLVARALRELPYVASSAAKWEAASAANAVANAVGADDRVIMRSGVVAARHVARNRARTGDDSSDAAAP